MMSSTAQLLLAASAPAVVHASLYGESSLNHTCALQPRYLSCSPSANLTLNPSLDTCCTETYGGLVLSTQFWDTYTGLESSGQVLPKDTWTLHGLWPDFCNGSYTQYCDLNRQYDPAPSPNTTNGKPNGTVIPPYTGPSISTFLAPSGKLDLLAYMSRYWINQGAPNGDFWGHEFSKHGTCYSTFDVPCYGPKYVEHEDVVDFFETAVSYYENLPTWAWLAAAGIRPSNTSTLSLADLQAALTEGFGQLPYIGCSGPRYNATAAGNGTLDNGYTVLSEVWYYHHVYGRVQSGQGLPVNASINGGSVSSCAKTQGALRYYERTATSEA